MLDNRKIIEVSQMIQDTNNFILQNPPKEVNLINALKPFMPETRHKALDETIDMFYKIHTIKRMSEQIAPLQPPMYFTHSAQQEYARDNSVHDDGIYDVDSSCVVGRRSSPAMAAMLMMMLGRG